MRTRLLIVGVLAAALIGLALSPAAAQDGRGVVRCMGSACASAISQLVFPRLFDVDPVSGALLSAEDSTRALATIVPMDIPADEVRITLRQGLTWSDGAPVSGYDLLHSYIQSSFGGELTGVRFVDAYTLDLRFTGMPTSAEPAANIPPLLPDCSDLPRSNLVLLPTPDSTPSFAVFADENAGDMLSYDDWNERYRAWRNENNIEFRYRTGVDAGTYTYAAASDDAEGNYIPTDATGAAFQLLRGTVDPFASFLWGETNLLLNVPLERRADITRARGGAQTITLPTRDDHMYTLIFNTADSFRPLPAFHPVTGEPIDQGEHRVFQHPEIRQAISLAINLDRIINTVFQGYAEPLRSFVPPISWAYNPDLPTLTYDPTAANRLLDDAGWVDANNDGTRDGLSFGLYSDSDEGFRIAEFIARDLERIGMRVQVEVNSGIISNQTFDMALISGLLRESDPDRSTTFDPAYDLPDLYIGSNVTSYNNPAVTALFEQAHTLPGCDVGERAALYREIQAQLRAENAFVPLLYTTTMHAAALGIQGFDPRPTSPLWNLESWVVPS
jgi:ABC-type transport system substrate-binding protein